MNQMTAPASPRARVLGFIEAFHAAPNDADIAVRIGADAAGTPAVIVSIGRANHALMVDEARSVAEIMENAMNTFPNDPESRTLPNIIMALRAGCDQAVAAAID